MACWTRSPMTMNITSSKELSCPSEERPTMRVTAQSTKKMIAARSTVSTGFSSRQQAGGELDRRDALAVHQHRNTSRGAESASRLDVVIDAAVQRVSRRWRKRPVLDRVVGGLPHRLRIQRLMVERVEILPTAHDVDRLGEVLVAFHGQFPSRDETGSAERGVGQGEGVAVLCGGDRKSTRLNSSHVAISYVVMCLK